MEMKNKWRGIVEDKARWTHSPPAIFGTGYSPVDILSADLTYVRGFTRVGSGTFMDFGYHAGQRAWYTSTNDGRIWKSTDCITWLNTATLSPAPTSSGYEGVMAYSPTKGRLAIAYRVSNTIYFAHSTDGITWTSVNTGFSATQDNLGRVFWCKNAWYIVSISSNLIIRSTNETSWVSITGLSGTPIAIATDGTQFLLVMSSGTIYRSTDGVSFTALVGVTNPPVMLNWYSAWEYMPGVGWFSMSNGFNPKTSPTGLVWTTQTGPGPMTTFTWVKWSTVLGALVWLTPNTGAIKTSLDGATWTDRASMRANLGRLGVR